MNETEMRALVAQALENIAPEVDLAERGAEDDLRECLDLDSMDFLNLVIALSAATGRDIPEADYPRLRTLAGMVAYFTS
jgi:acyl carrier protein